MLPDDSCLELAWRRATHFGIRSYYPVASETRKLIDLPIGEEAGIRSDGTQVLESAECIRRRVGIINERSAKCGCGGGKEGVVTCKTVIDSNGKLHSKCGCARVTRGLEGFFAECDADAIRCGAQIGLAE